MKSLKLQLIIIGSILLISQSFFQCSSSSQNRAYEKVKMPEITADRDTFIIGEEQVKFSMIDPEIKHKEWSIDIRDKDDKLVKSFKGKGKIKKVLEWNGIDRNGKLVQPDKQFTIIARGIDSTGEEWESNIVTVKSLMKLVKGITIVIRAIYFAPFSSEITPSPKTALDRIYEILVKYPKVKFLIKGHIDPSEKLFKLSQDRAKAARQYLINKGIDPKRLELKGYGDTEPATDKDTPEGRSLNRRIEFDVIE